MSTSRHLSLLAAAAILLHGGIATADVMQRDTALDPVASADRASGFAVVAAVEAEPLSSTEMDEVRGRSDLLTMTSQMLEMNQQFNMHYLMLQQSFQAENRQFTVLSNIMKTKHDTAKNALNNLK